MNFWNDLLFIILKLYHSRLHWNHVYGITLDVISSILSYYFLNYNKKAKEFDRKMFPKNLFYFFGIFPLVFSTF